MYVDYIQNGSGYGQVGEALAGCRYDPGLMRPYIDSRGVRCVTVNTGRKDPQSGKTLFEKRTVADVMAQGVFSPVFNATSLRKEEWIELDKVVVKAARQRLRAWADLEAANSFGGFNGMSKSILEYEAMSDVGEAIVDMDGLSGGRGDSPQYQLRGLPLPITHSDFTFGARRLAESRNSGMPLDLSMAEQAGRRIAEKIEKTLIGVDTGITYGGGATTPQYDLNSTVFGYTNYTNRNTKVDLNTPLGTNPEAVMTDVLEMRDQLMSDRFYGPYILYYSTPYESFMDNDYFRSGSTAISRTLRERIKAIDMISDVRRLDFLDTGFVMIMVQMTPDVARAINGMDITTVQWETQGGMSISFKTMCIKVPQLRSDFYGNAGLVHATTA